MQNVLHFSWFLCDSAVCQSRELIKVAADFIKRGNRRCESCVIDRGNPPGAWAGIAKGAVADVTRDALRCIGSTGAQAVVFSVVKPDRKYMLAAAVVAATSANGGRRRRPRFIGWGAVAHDSRGCNGEIFPLPSEPMCIRNGARWRGAGTTSRMRGSPAPNLLLSIKQKFIPNFSSECFRINYCKHILVLQRCVFKDGVSAHRRTQTYSCFEFSRMTACAQNMYSSHTKIFTASLVKHSMVLHREKALTVKLGRGSNGAGKARAAAFRKGLAVVRHC